MNENNSNEVAFLFSPISFRCEKQFGTIQQVNVFENPLAFEMLRHSGNMELFLIHNHPSTKTFSYSDIGVLLLHDAIGGITVVTNTGDVHLLYKTNKYSFEQAYESLSEIRHRYTEKNLDETADADVVKLFLKSCKDYGIISI